ncbi:hypothetical protein [Actinokineospora sp. HUAS TT18]|uniref:hypothetical protein n=1 Tax=Actinokineospora sp. HUAS TT18 TaxID=3447451 RepID=UPI003F526E7C
MNVDDLLADAGERWRAEQPPPPEIDFTRFGRRGPWAMAGAAAAAVTVAIAGIAVLNQSPAPSPPTDAPVIGDQAKLIVREGMTVHASGRVIAVPGKPVRLCAPTPIAPVGGRDPDFADCAYTGVTVTGVDLASLTNRREQGGSIAGGAGVTGVYSGGTVQVTEQGPLVVPPPAPVTKPREVPCAAPPGGWRQTDANNHALHEYVEQHAAELAAPWVGYPDGPPTGPTASLSYAKPMVVVVEVVSGDVDRVRADLAERYTGNLCVVPAAPGTAAKGAAAQTMAEIRPIMEDPTSGVYTAGGGETGRVKVELVMVDQRLYDKFAAIGFDRLDLEPWLRPIAP